MKNKNINTAFYKNAEGNFKIITDNMTQRELREEINGNGFKVVAIMKGMKTIEDLEKLQGDRF